MLDPSNIPPIDDDEMLARYVLFSKAVRQDGRIKPDALIPYKLQDLSVTRHREATKEEIWKLGQQVAAQRAKILRGRIDIQAKDCRIEGLTVVADSLPDNPNHANIEDWPPDKESQKALAQELAANCIFISYP